MKTVYFFRHAKSDWEAEFGADRERPIKKRGVKDARRVGRFLAETDQLPDLVLCSPALRTRQTLAEAVKGGNWPEVEEHLIEGLYESTAERVLFEIREIPDTAEVVLLLGHEPTWSDAVAHLIGGGTVRMVTASVARVDLDVARWVDVTPGYGELIWLLPPKLLRPFF